MRSSGNSINTTRFIGLVLALFATLTASGQAAKCLEPGKLELLKKQIMSNEKPAENGALRISIISAASELSAKQRYAPPPKSSDGSIQKRPTFDEPSTTFVCSVLNTQGWPKSAAVGRDAVASFFFLIARGMSIQMQFELNPIVAGAYAAGEIEAGELLAAYLDRLRVAIGKKQLFGTQVYVRDDFLVMAPIEQPSRVEERRAQYQMMPLRSYERFLERSYQKVLIRSVMEPMNPNGKPGATSDSVDSAPMVDGTDDKDVLKVKTSFVSMDVVVPDSAVGAAGLEKKDFRVFENDKPVDIETFAKTEAPFDIVLLLDMSDSTSDKSAVIRKTTRRFIEMKRGVDRVAVVAFDQAQTVISELESNNELLLSRVKGIKSGGGSNIWDAIKFGLDLLDKDGEKGRRKAIVLMSDGEENSLMYLSGVGSKISFADLVEVVRRGSTAIFPIYLESERRRRVTDRTAVQARQTLNYLADQSAGNMYQAKEIEDLNTVYGRVLTDVGTVYSLGFEPEEDTSTNDNWRTLRVEVPSRPELKLKYRPGYFVR